MLRNLAGTLSWKCDGHVGGKGWIQRGLDRLERWGCANLMECNTAKCRVMHLGWGNPKHQNRLGRNGLKAALGGFRCWCEEPDRTQP